MSLENKVAVVTGGTEGIGKALARRFVEDGIKSLYLVSRTPSKLTQTVKEFNDIRKCVSSKQGDIINFNSIKTIIDDIYHIEGTIDIWVNNAGQWYPHSIHTNIEDLANNLNLIGNAPILITQYLVQKAIRADKELKILNILSQAGLWDISGDILDNNLSYGPGKSLLRSYLFHLEHELELYKDKKIRLYGLFPGTVGTDKLKKEIQSGILKEPIPVEYVVDASLELLEEKLRVQNQPTRYLAIKYNSERKCIERLHYDHKKLAELIAVKSDYIDFNLPAYIKKLKAF